MAFVLLTFLTSDKTPIQDYVHSFVMIEVPDGDCEADEVERAIEKSHFIGANAGTPHALGTSLKVPPDMRAAVVENLGVLMTHEDMARRGFHFEGLVLPA